MIDVKSLRVDYEGVTAVLDLSLQVAKGHIYGLVGPNGAGKTSTIRALAGLLEPTYGEIKIDGVDLDLEPKRALGKIGFMPDFPPVYENLKVWEYLDVFAAAYLIPQEERLQRSREWVQKVNLLEKWDAYVRDLSRGMRQRLVLAKTLLHDPQVLLLDEPASGLDPAARLQLRSILKEVALLGKTIIISSHILPELSDFCDAVGIMERGRLITSGTIAEIRQQMGLKKGLRLRFWKFDEDIKKNFYDVIQRYAFVSNLRSVKEGEYLCDLAASEEEMAQLLNALLGKQLPLFEFAVKEADVEDIFFKVGAMTVS